MLNYYKVNDHQYIEIYPTLANPTEDRLSHIAFETTNAQQLRDYLAAHGVQVPATLKPGLDKNLSMMIKDPEGHSVEFVQYMPGSLHSNNFGKFLPATRISQRMIHVGITVQNREAADRFYKDILGFKMTWYGGMTNDRPTGSTCVFPTAPTGSSTCSTCTTLRRSNRRSCITSRLASRAFSPRIRPS